MQFILNVRAHTAPHAAHAPVARLAIKRADDAAQVVRPGAKLEQGAPVRRGDRARLKKVARQTAAARIIIAAHPPLVHTKRRMITR